MAAPRGPRQCHGQVTETELAQLPEARILFPRQANSLFVELPAVAIEGLQKAGWRFYTFIGQGGCRFMCAWDIREEDVRALVADIKRLIG